MEEKVSLQEDSLVEFRQELERLTICPKRLDVAPERVGQDLAKLVLALIDFLRKLLEKQALRRIEAGSLTPEEIERMGLAFLRLEEKLEELKAHFGLADEDLSLNLGPLGELM